MKQWDQFVKFYCLIVEYIYRVDSRGNATSSFYRSKKDMKNSIGTTTTASAANTNIDPYCAGFKIGSIEVVAAP